MFSLSIAGSPPKTEQRAHTPNPWRPWNSPDAGPTRLGRG